ncbi:MAG TPA: HAMP domain-containing sensor histidine kinase [Ktedonosporobacter sp.]|nr:HAMP domain-containing sensor histidine kinase [Ktedonosporobacter sp.]
MKPHTRANSFLGQIPTLPLSALRLSRGHQVLIVALSYGLAVPGLWLLYPLVHNGASLLLPIISASFLFRYRGLLITLALNVAAILLVYLFLLPDLVSGQVFVVRVLLGSAISLVLGLAVCWLRTAVEVVQGARSRAQAAEQERLLAEHAERQAMLAYEQQRQVNELKDHFLLHVNHELRTPLTVLGGSLELLKEYQEQLDPVEQTRILKRAYTSYEELAHLVDRVLEVTTLMSETPPASPEVVRVHQFLQEVLAQLDPGDVNAYTIRVQVGEQVLVWADPQMLRQVLCHLLSNVFKYVPTQTEIRIETSQAAASAPVCLWVQDAGPGIPAEELPRLFEPLVRLKRDVAGTARGTGVGLFICKRFVEAMGGQIWVESSGREGRGSRFGVTLPSLSF